MKVDLVIWNPLRRLGCVGLLLSFFIITFTACQSRSNETALPRFEIVKNSNTFPVKIPNSFENTIGWLVVAENRQSSSPKEIKLPVAIIHNRLGKSEKSPILYLSGGPGTSALSAAAYPSAYPWTDTRDFIVIGQRGTHFAKPPLMCPEYNKASKNGTDIYRAIAKCRDRLSNDGIELNQYNSLTSAQDIEDLRKVLELETLNLYGVSYGTRLALTYARYYSNHIRTMVLDSPLPPNAIYDDESARNFETAIRSVARDCAAQDSCSKAYPDLELRFFDALKADEPFLGKGESAAKLSAYDFLPFINLSTEDSIQQAPMIMDGIVRKDPRLIEGIINSTEVDDFAWGMRLSVWCQEAWPYSDRSQREFPKPILGGFESAAVNPDFCEIWNVKKAENNVIEPVESKVPTLLIAGQFDPLTPPKWGQLAAQSLPQSLVVSVRGEGHTPTQNWDGDGCAMQLANEFIANPQKILNQENDTQCVFSRSAPEYLTSLP